MKLAEMSLEDGGSILVEVVDFSGDHKIGNTNAVEKVNGVFDKAVTQIIGRHCQVLVNAFAKLQEGPVAPSRAKAEFGIQLSAEGKLFLVKASSQTNFKISVEWEFAGKAGKDG